MPSGPKGREAPVTRTRIWLTVVAFVGLTAGALAATLVWMVMTRPVALAQLIGTIW
jgi:hypothetical protein